jgi:hypothetical protein
LPVLFNAEEIVEVPVPTVFFSVPALVIVPPVSEPSAWKLQTPVELLIRVALLLSPKAKA